MTNVYDYAVDLASDTAPARIIRLCGVGKRVLEIGAGPGSISRILVEERQCSVVCVEKDRSSLESLRSFCQSVYEADLNDPTWTKTIANEGVFDVVIVADVLEHLVDPWRALEEIKAFIAPGASLLLSIPHSGHRALIAALIGGDVSYRDWGLLDRTHIRFFGMQNIQHLVDCAGLSVVEAEFVVRPPSTMELGEKWHSLPAAMRDCLAGIQFADVYQVVARLEPTKSDRNYQRLTDIKSPVSKEAPPVKVIAFYLPQFHPIEENNVWWGKGFTEWTNVSKAVPLFKNHYQPRLPGELGFYDLRLRENRLAQIKLAKQYAIDGFCYYYYWFSGERILERPLDEMLADPESDMPFCLCWANENWTRRWDGQGHEVLIAQRYLPDDDEHFIRDTLPYFRDKRYIRFNGKPVLIVYNPQHLPNAPRAARIWRDICRVEGIGEIFLVSALVFGNEDYRKFEFDASVEFPPHNLSTPNYAADLNLSEEVQILREYEEVAKSYLGREYWPDGGRVGFRTVFPSWDNTARTGSRGTVMLNSTPENYEFWLKEAIRKTREDFKTGDRMVFVNAWNEWAEGAHLEPDRKYGRRLLEATLRAKTGQSTLTDFADRGTGDYGPIEGSKSAQKVIENALELRSYRLGREIEDMYRSLSWRLTAPIRSVQKMLGELGIISYKETNYDKIEWHGD